MEQTYKHVIVVGIDGAGSFISEADTPNFDRIFTGENGGAVTYDALASFPSISAECWGSMLTGVSPAIHKLTNDIVSSRHYPDDTPYPTLFKRIREGIPNAVIGSFCDWSPISNGICEVGLDVTMDSAGDTELTPRICAYIEKEKPTFLFIQMDSVDGAGHGNGYGTPNHLKRIHEVDELLAQIYTSVENAGIADDTLFCLIADHGGTCIGSDGRYSGSHGGWSEGERYVTFAAAGKTVKPGTIGDMNVRDLSAIVLHALGIPSPEFKLEGWTSQIPQNLFTDIPSPVYEDLSGEVGAPPRVSRRHHETELL